MFTAPVVVVFQAIALLPGVLQADPQADHRAATRGTRLHSATSVLAYGALALAAVAGVMFLVLDRQLKEHHLQSGLFRNLPPVRELLVSLERLLWLGGGLLTVGILAGFLMPHDPAALGHLLAALAVWIGLCGVAGRQDGAGSHGPAAVAAGGGVVHSFTRRVRIRLMELLCLGLNHRTAPVEVRERFAVGTTKLGEAATELVAMTGVTEGVVISTCNRTEFYLAAPVASAALPTVGIPPRGQNPARCRRDRPFLSARAKPRPTRHLCRVVSGLDSMMLGETEIFGQVKQAYQAALEAGATAGVLNRLFQRAFGVGKKVRTETSIQEGSTSVGNVAVDLAEKIFGHLKDSEVMILGAGEMSRITAQSLVSRGARSIFVSNRSFDRAAGTRHRNGRQRRALRRLAARAGTRRRGHFLDRLCRIAIVHRADVEKARRARKYRPLFFIDIAVPRDIDPAVGEIEEVYLYDIDTLEQLADEARGRRQLQIEECDRIIDAELAKFNLLGTRPDGR